MEYPQIEPNTKPQHRFMSAYEQKIEVPDKNFKFILFAAEPYITIAFKIPNLEIDNGPDKFVESWDAERKIYIMVLHFKE
jgi:splicing factor 3A subunit 2